MRNGLRSALVTAGGRVAVVAMAVASALAVAAAPEAADAARICETPSGIRYGVWGAAGGRPAPLLIILATTIEGTLGEAYFRQAGNALADPAGGGDAAVCVSIDLPCHGRDRRADEPAELAGWRHRLERGDDPVALNNRRLSAVVDHLIATGRIDRRRIAVIGTSRGGFLATHFLAHDARVACAAVYSPVTDLLALAEFAGAGAVPAVRAAALHHSAVALAGRHLWMTIGGDDRRVGTDRAIALAADIAAAAAAGKVADRAELTVVRESPGHGTPPGSAERSAAWIRDRFAAAVAAPSGR